MITHTQKNLLIKHSISIYAYTYILLLPFSTPHQNRFLSFFTLSLSRRLAVFATFLHGDTTPNLSIKHPEEPFSPHDPPSLPGHTAARFTHHALAPQQAQGPLHASRLARRLPPTTRNQTDPKQPPAYLLIPNSQPNFQIPHSPPLSYPPTCVCQRLIIHNPYNPYTLTILTCPLLPTTTFRNLASRLLPPDRQSSLN